MTIAAKTPLKGHWPVAFVLGGTDAEPALVPINYSMKSLAGDEYRVPIGELPSDPESALRVGACLDGKGRYPVRPARDRISVIDILSIPVFADRPIIVGTRDDEALGSLSPEPGRAVITLTAIREVAAKVAPDRERVDRAPGGGSGNALSQARNTAFAVYWALGDEITPTRRRQAMATLGWPAGTLDWVASTSSK